MPSRLRDNIKLTYELMRKESQDKLTQPVDNELNKESLDVFADRMVEFVNSKEELAADELTDFMIMNAVERTSVDEPGWRFFAATLLLQKLYKKASRNRFYQTERKYGDFYGLLESLTEIGIYDSDILMQYSQDDLNEAASFIVPERDLLLDYVGLRSLSERYLATNYQRDVLELPQERWLIMALYLLQGEDHSVRMSLVKQAYDVLSELFITMATPTLANAGKTYGQLSSCFEIVVDDSLDGIYDSVHTAARLSKGGGGIGVYAGFIRPRGAAIQGFEGTAGGTIPFLKLFDATAVAVDQLGVRKGAIAVYQDVWHPDILAFLDLRLNNGDESNRAHNLHLGVNIPDLFMKQVEKDGEWHLFDPHEVFLETGSYLQDSFDESTDGGSFTDFYQKLVNNPNISRITVKAKTIWLAIIRSQLETGYPYMFYRDTVNRLNPNSHAGVVYASNLCSEIIQNQSQTVMVNEDLLLLPKGFSNGNSYDATEAPFIERLYQPGDTVVCNLSSITLPRVVRKDDSPEVTVERLTNVISIQVRMLDNVIDLNSDSIPALDAVATNHAYRAVGIGTSGWHQLLAEHGIHWESDEAVQMADELFEGINYAAVHESMKLAQERGAYPLFEGSDWHSGEYFTKRNYSSEDWQFLAQLVHKNGIRNGYLMAVAPTGSTSLISGVTAGLDGVTDITYVEEKKDMRIPVVVPNLNALTYEYYKPAYQQDQSWSIKQNAARQRHVDQSQSFNLYLNANEDMQGGGKKAVKLNKWHFEAWRAGLKTTYYVRSQTVMAEDCVWCES